MPPILTNIKTDKSRTETRKVSLETKKRKLKFTKKNPTGTCPHPYWMHVWYCITTSQVITFTRFSQYLTTDLEFKVTGIQTPLRFIVDAPMVWIWKYWVTSFLSYCSHKLGFPTPGSRQYPVNKKKKKGNEK